LWFEIERGQFDLITMVICFLAIYIYHHHPRFRLAAYFLFILSVNLKIYPGIFIICFTTDWQDWKNNLRRWALLLIGSFSGLFILGWKIFLEFVNALIIQMSHPTYVWIGNHSIDSFVRLMVNKLSELNPVLLNSLNANIRWFDIAFLLIYVLCLVGIIRMTYRHKMNASNPYMLLIITLGTMLIPSTSHDYKLCILIPPMVMLFNNLELNRSGKNILDLSAIVLVSLISLSYSATLFLHTDLPFLLASNFPYLFILCVSIVLLLWVRTAQSRRIENQVVFQDIS